LDPLADPFLSDCHIPSPKGHDSEGLRRWRRRRSRERLGRFLGLVRRDWPGLRLRRRGGGLDSLSAVCGGTSRRWGGSGKGKLLRGWRLSDHGTDRCVMVGLGVRRNLVCWSCSHAAG
jgi:hypothetical protein